MLATWRGGFGLKNLAMRFSLGRAKNCSLGALPPDPPGEWAGLRPAADGPTTPVQGQSSKRPDEHFRGGPQTLTRPFWNASVSTPGSMHAVAEQHLVLFCAQPIKLKHTGLQ
jgi:hypothetical protein